MKISNTAFRLMVLAILTVLLLNFPFLATSNKAILQFGVPNLYIYIFLVWLIIILIVFFLSKPTQQKQDN